MIMMYLLKLLKKCLILNVLDIYFINNFIEL